MLLFVQDIYSNFEANYHVKKWPSHPFSIRVPLPGPRQFLATKSPLKMIKTLFISP